MKILPKILALLVFMLPLGAESLPVVTLDEALEAAAENNTSLEQQEIVLKMTTRSADSYLSAYIPTFGISATASTGLSFPDATNNSTRFDGINLNLGANATFSYTLDGSKITESASSRLTKESASLTYESYRDSLELLVTTSYWTLATYDIAIENAKEALDSAQKTYESTKEMYDSGMVDELTLSRTELSVTNETIALQNAEDAKAQAMASFKALTGLTDDFTTEPLPDTVILSFPEAEVLFDEYAESTTAIRSARNSLETSRNAETKAKLNQYMPTVTATIGYQYQGGLSDTRSYSTATHGLNGSVAVSLPLSSYIPGSAMDLAKKNASDQVALDSLALKSAQDDLLDTLRQSIMTINQAQYNLNILDSTLSIAERSYNLSEEAYEAGLISADDLSDSRKELLSAQNNLLSAKLNQLISSYNLANTLGIELQELQEEYTIKESV